VLLRDALRGVAWSGDDGTPYPRADPADAGRLPMDTWGTARLPVGVRLELVGDAPELELDYRCATGDLGYRGPGAGTTFSVWRGGLEVATAPAALTGGTARLALRRPETLDDEVATVYLPEGMRPTLLDARAVGGELGSAPTRPRWLAYGDSITEGWIASGPAGAWPAVAARDFALDVVNLGYAGAARGEIATAEQLAALDADVISLAYGTNCWTRIPHSTAQFRAGFDAFLAVVRQGHPTTPIVVASPVIRPDAEATPNRLGATLLEFRTATEQAVAEQQDAGDATLTLVRGGPLLTADLLPDGIHPGDDGHRLLAEHIGGAVAAAVSRAATSR
jgi:lysophospholipase L1-like esterase